ncbi:hypothetical protein ACP70R_003694 [Stipagrostis hirtigluma subsp. patula]
MATNAPCVPVGPVPFKDVDDDTDVVTVLPARASEDQAHLVSPLPSKTLYGALELRLYQGFWLPESWVPAAMALQRRFEPRPDDVIAASMPKCGTTWLVSLVFATMARRAYPPGAADHPLRRLNAHQCAPLLEGLFSGGRERKLDELPSPRLMYTHLPLAMIPRAVAAADGSGGGGCRVVYLCREPKDMVVSLLHFFGRVYPGMSLRDVFESACDGAMMCGPFWDHIAGYRRAGESTPSNVLFLQYEDLLRDPAENVRRVAQFIGMPFSPAEEEDGIVGGIVELCSLGSLRGMEANKTGYVDPVVRIPRGALFRKGVAGDWMNHLTPEMAHRMDEILDNKFGATGLKFPAI